MTQTPLAIAAEVVAAGAAIKSMARKKNPAPKGFISGPHMHDPRDPGVYYPPKAVKAALRARAKAPRKKRRKNPPQHFYIHVQKHGRGPIMLYNGKSFSSAGNAKPAMFTTAHAAMYKARHLLGRYKILSQYKIWVSDKFFGEATKDTRVNPRRRNPESLDEARKKLEDFTGREATDVLKAPSRSNEKTGLVIGTLDQIGYQAAREGIDGGRLARYLHKFRKGSRPLLAVSKDGKQLHVVGGQYEFTEAGIEDR